jgi:hypothetical protein
VQSPCTVRPAGGPLTWNTSPCIQHLVRYRVTAIAWLAFAAAGPSGADTASEQIVGAIEAVVFVCGPIDAKSAKAGLDLLESTRVARKLDLPALRKTEAYKSMYNSEANRLLSLPTKERLAACKSAW